MGRTGALGLLVCSHLGHKIASLEKKNDQGAVAAREFSESYGRREPSRTPGENTDMRPHSLGQIPTRCRGEIHEELIPRLTYVPVVTIPFREDERLADELPDLLG
ncbi:hypothetical protein AVEN_59768-1 [Araneus ventricosus]|uniref:Uncharacterized protein n=1 Tax=Araneus ventricosus TaxID=182803 RepID=A0A4Y2PBJ5_ARAVE|nr:hypothetical protein AVEN_59768-1 [Araneus ventricosus]